MFYNTIIFNWLTEGQMLLEGGITVWVWNCPYQGELLGMWRSSRFTVYLYPMENSPESLKTLTKKWLVLIPVYFRIYTRRIKRVCAHPRIKKHLDLLMKKKRHLAMKIAAPWALSLRTGHLRMTLLFHGSEFGHSASYCTIRKYK